MLFLQCGQCDGGLTIELFLGIRTIQTFKKLPTMAPKMNAIGAEMLMTVFLPKFDC